MSKETDKARKRAKPALDASIPLEPVYDDSYSQIVDPVVELRVPAYFLKNWIPRLPQGASLTYLQLRQMCWYDLKNPRNTRDYCWPKQATLARLIHSSRRSVAKYLRELEDQRLIERYQNYQYDHDKGKRVRVVDTYRVPFYVQLTPEDVERQAAMDAEQLGEEVAVRAPASDERPMRTDFPKVREADRAPMGSGFPWVVDKPSYPPPKGKTFVGPAAKQFPTEDVPEDGSKNVNVDQVQEERKPEGMSEKRLEDRDRRAHGLLQALYRASGRREDPPNDHRNLPYLKRVAGCLPEDLLHKAEVATLDAARDGRVSGERTFQYFHGVVRNLARQARIDVGMKSRS